MQQVMAQPKVDDLSARGRVEINFGKGMSLEGVTNILESDENSIVATLDKNILTITGDKLSLDTLDVEKRLAKISGNVTALKYSKEREKMPLLKRVFK
ncbi:MAG: YabP/YqfC family sporulation protein [Clostridia bacterium]